MKFFEAAGRLRWAKRWRMVGSALLLFPTTTLFAFTADSPVTPGAAPEARSLLAFFADIYGKKIISGQQDGWRHTNGLSLELNYITNTTGKLPALLAMDLSGYTSKPLRSDTNHWLAKSAVQWFQQRNGIVEFCCHWRAPMNAPEFYTKDTTFDISRAVIVGTPEYAATESDLDALAGQLEVLRDARVPVLWRPLHEANGRWFWWGAGGPEPFKKLWRMMFENFTVKHHLNNLIWVFSPGAETDLAAWYPGDAYVDIIGQDHYPMDGNHGAAADVFNELKNMTREQKLIALGENGPIPDPALMVQESARWLFFTTWSGSILFEKTTPEQLRAYYNHPDVLTLADLPDLKNYPAPATDEATRLAFPTNPGAVANGGAWRSPLTVLVQDENGKTVREGHFTVTLALKNSHGQKLSGTTTATSVNGVATFADIKISAADTRCELTARAKKLRTATSSVFQVGPGNGLLREAAGSKEILSHALETPVTLATNFFARISGKIIPPQTGDYRFSVAGGGRIELWLGPDAAGASNLVSVIGSTPYRKWPHINEADSPDIALVAGRKYYFEIRQQQPNGSTQLHVRWRLPDGAEERPIPAFRFVQP